MNGKVIYIAGPYTSPSGHDHKGYSDIDRNIAQARDAFVRLAEAGVGAFCPHTHSAHFEVIAPDVPPSYWYDLDIFFLRRSHAILMLPGWQSSAGSMKEYNMAEFELHIPVFYDTASAIDWALRAE